MSCKLQAASCAVRGGFWQPVSIKVSLLAQPCVATMAALAAWTIQTKSGGGDFVTF